MIVAAKKAQVMEAAVLVLTGLFAGLAPVLFGSFNSLYVLLVLLPCFLGAAFFFAGGLFRNQRGFPPAFWMTAVVMLYLAGLHFIAPVSYFSLLNLLGLAGLLLAYWMWASLCDSWKRFRWLWGALLVLLTALCWYGIWLYLHENMGGFYHDQNEVLIHGQNPFYKGARLLGTYYSPNQFVSLVVMGIVLSFGLFFVPAAGWGWKVLSLQYWCVAFPCLYLSGSRGGWLEFLVGITVLAALLLWKRCKLWGHLLMLLFLAALAGGAYLLYKHNPFIAQRISTGSAGRFVVWEGVRAMIHDRPLLGWGSGMFRYVYPAYKTLGGESQFAFHAFSEYLQVWSEYGVGGLVLSLAAGVAWYVRWVMHYVRSTEWKSTVVSAVVLAIMTGALVHGFVDYNLTMYGNRTVLILILGTAAGLELMVRRENTAAFSWKTAVGNASGGVASLALLGVTLVLFMNQLCITIGNRKLYLAKDCPAALQWFDKAEKWYSGYFWLYHHRAVAQRSQIPNSKTPQVFREQAITSHTREYALNPYFAFASWGLASMYEQRKDYDMQLAFLRESIARDPQRGLYWQYYFRRLHRMGKEDAIQDGCRRALTRQVLSAGELRRLLAKEKIKGVDLKAISREVKENPQPVPRRIFVEDSMALTPLYSWTWADDGTVASAEHLLLEKRAPAE